MTNFFFNLKYFKKVFYVLALLFSHLAGKLIRDSLETLYHLSIDVNNVCYVTLTAKVAESKTVSVCKKSRKLGNKGIFY